MSWSLSRLKTFEQCHAKYNYRYNDKLPDTYRGTAAERGILIHKGIEEAFKGPQPVPVEASVISGYVDALKSGTAKFYPEFTIKLDREWKQVITGDYWYHGILDLLLFPSPKVAHVRDWKTGSIYPDHDQQKELYALAVFSAFPEIEEIQTFFDYLDKGKSVTKTFFNYMVAPARQRWEARVAKMELASEFIPMPGYGCRYCSFSASRGGPCRF